MRKEQKQSVITRKSFTSQEIDDLYKEVKGDLSHESRNAWLLKHKAARFKDYGKGQIMLVIQKADGTYPYNELAEKWEALTTRENKKAFAQAQQDLSYEQVMNTSNPLEDVPPDLFSI